MKTNNEDLLVIDGTRATLNMATSKTLQPIPLNQIVNFGIQIFFTGSPTGNFKLQVSNDPGRIMDPIESEQYATVTNWTDVANSAFTVSAAGDVYWDVQNSGAAWVRAVWTPTGGSGTITSARAVVKGA